jgi:DNA polymerase-3 subunit alpha
LRAFRSHQTTELKSSADKIEVTVGGLITGVTIRNVSKSRSGLTRMVKFTFEDLAGSTPAMLWPEEFAKNESLIREDAIVFVKGTMNRTREPAELVVNRVIPIEQAAAELSRGIVVTLRKGSHQDGDVDRLHRQVRSRNNGNLELYFEIFGLTGVRRAIFRAGSSHRVRLDDQLLSDLESAVGPGNVRLVGQGGSTSGGPSQPAARTAVAVPDDESAEEESDDED